MKAILTLLLFLGITLSSPMLAFGDDHGDSKEHKDDDEFAEDIGELLGWVAVALTAVPVALYPAKKLIPTVMRSRKEFKSVSVSILPLLKKVHMPIGILIFFLLAWHGGLLVWAEGEFGTDEWIGTIALAVAVIGGFVGASFAKKRRMKSLRLVHIGLLVVAIGISVVHVLLA